MRTSLVCVAFAVLSAGGCERASEGGSYYPAPVAGSGKRPALPGAAEVAEVRYTPPHGARGTTWPPATTLNQPEAILEAVRWLHAVDWSATPATPR